jgi:hypothetical protein
MIYNLTPNDNRRHVRPVVQSVVEAQSGKKVVQLLAGVFVGADSATLVRILFDNPVLVVAGRIR